MIPPPNFFLECSSFYPKHTSPFWMQVGHMNYLEMTNGTSANVGFINWRVANSAGVSGREHKDYYSKLQMVLRIILHDLTVCTTWWGIHLSVIRTATMIDFFQADSSAAEPKCNRKITNSQSLATSFVRVVDLICQRHYSSYFRPWSIRVLSLLKTPTVYICRVQT